LKYDGDIIKPEYFQTIMEAYKSTFNITVTSSSGKHTPHMTCAGEASRLTKA